MNQNLNENSPLDNVTLLSSAQLRQIAGGVSDMTIWRWVKAGIIPKPKKIRKRNYWPKTETIAALESTSE
ncbi:MAG: transcriptional regulator [Candidatus Thiodiazotropha endolucinida]|nr:transcriptional regulator [Candidatus Thiodiazotropha endolucinida]